jgi:hypothetical protein
MTTYTASDLAVKIIHEQETIIGPLAWSVAKHVSGMTIQSKDRVTIAKSGSTVLEALVKKYEKLFGPASREVCRDAVRTMVSKTSDKDLPEILK